MSARRHRGTPSIVLSALLGVVACALLAPVLPTPAAAAASSHDGACVGDTGVTVVVDATNVGAGIRVQLRARRAGERVGSAEERGSHRRADPDRGGRGVPDRRLPVRGLPDMLGDELLELPPRTERAARVPRGRSARRVRRRTSPRPGSVEGWKYTSTVDPEGSARRRTGLRGGHAADDTAADRTTRVDATAGTWRGKPEAGRGAIGRVRPVRAGSDRHDRRCADDRRGRTGRRHNDQPAEHRDRRRGRFDDDRTRIIAVPTAPTGARSVASTSAARRTRRVASRSRWSPGSRSSSRSRRARASSRSGVANST